ncbi:YdiK family protein [Bacillus thuringiensis]
MRNSPFVMATLYFLLGCIFTYLAITSVKDTIWNFHTISLAVMATVDFNLAIRILFSKPKKDSKKK